MYQLIFFKFASSLSCNITPVSSWKCKHWHICDPWVNKKEMLSASSTDVKLLLIPKRFFYLPYAAFDTNYFWIDTQNLLGIKYFPSFVNALLFIVFLLGNNVLLFLATVPQFKKKIRLGFRRESVALKIFFGDFIQKNGLKESSYYTVYW